MTRKRLTYSPTRNNRPTTNKYRLSPMRHRLSRILPLILLTTVLLSCDKTPGGVLSVNDMADLIVDLQVADAYIENHIGDFASDSSKQVIKQSVFKKHGITQQDYDSSLVWYAHNMEDYVKAYDKAIGKLQARHDKLANGKVDVNAAPAELNAGGGPAQHSASAPPAALHPKNGKLLKHKLNTDTKSDTADLWRDARNYMLTPGSRRGFITFDVAPDANKMPGDRYELAYKLIRGGNEFKVSLCVDYTDGTTAQMARGTNSDGWVTVDVQSDTARQVRRIYGYVSYDLKRGHTAYVDSLMLVRTRFDKSRYGFIHAQRLLKRGKK